MASASLGRPSSVVAERRRSKHLQCKSYHLPKTSNASLDGDAYVRIQSIGSLQEAGLPKKRTPFADRSNIIFKPSQRTTCTIAGPCYPKDKSEELTDSWVLDPSIGHIDTEHLLPIKPPSKAPDSSHGLAFSGLPALPAPSSLHMSTFLGQHNISVGSRGESTPGMAEPLFHQADLIRKLPTVLHPNSPYVPWSADERERILSTSTSTSYRSLPTLEKHFTEPVSFVRLLPEPVGDHSGKRLLKVSRSLRNLTSLAQKNMRRLRTRLFRIPAPLPTLQSKPGTPPLGILDSPSCRSVGSAETTSLAAWLATRQADHKEYVEHIESGILLEEYERVGSWRDLPLNEGAGDSVQPLGFSTLSPGYQAKPLEASPRMPGGWIPN